MLFYQPVMNQRYFSAGKKYDSINWNSLVEVVKAFETRVHDWYINPAEELRKSSWDNSFAVMAINCLLIDALSQYHYGEYRSSRTLFRRYSRKKIGSMRQKLPEPVAIPQERRPNRRSPKTARPRAKKKFLRTFADALYFTFRCGILHEAHIYGCGGISGLGGKLADVDPDICTRYRNGSDCPTIRMDPFAILDEVKAVFSRYVHELLDPNPKYDSRRKKFKRKFSTCIGIDITGAK